IAVFDDTINLFPSDHKIYSNGLNKIFNFKNISFQLLCYGYTGYNCQYDDIETDLYRTDFKTGYLVCKDSTNCQIEEKTCSDNNRCNNHGMCYKNNLIYCACDEGYAGEFCEMPDCYFDEDELYFGNPDKFCRKKSCTNEDYCYIVHVISKNLRENDVNFSVIHIVK
ncbi:hypothetical protein HZS_5365, partial [Henneguya salminicola]